MPDDSRQEMRLLDRDRAEFGGVDGDLLPVSRELAIRAQLLEEGGPEMWDAFMAELRSIHLGAPAPRRSVFRELTDAYEKEIRTKKV